MSTIFDNIKELCRRPHLLSGIEDVIKEQITDEKVEERAYVKRDIKSKYYSDSENNTSIDEIRQNMIFIRVVKGRQPKCGHIQPKSVDIVEAKAKVCNTKIKKRSKASETKCDTKRRNPLKPILTIDLDISSKIKEIMENQAKQGLKPSKKPRTRKASKSPKESVSDSLSSVLQDNPSPLADGGYPSIVSPSISVSNSTSYSNPATPLSSSDGYFSLSSVTSCETTSSVLSQIRQTMNAKYETYGQHIRRKIENELKHKLKKRNKKAVDYNKKVLEWTNKFCSGDSTPVHSIEYSETPPASPSPALDLNTDNDLNAMITSIESEIPIEDNERINDEFNSILSDLYASVMNSE